MSQTKKSGDLGCALAFSLVATQPWEHLLIVQMDEFTFLENEWSEMLLGPFSNSKLSKHQVVEVNATGGPATLTVLFPLHSCRQKVRLPEADVVQPGPQTLHAEMLAPLLCL